jgi:hypothetical protein
MSREFNGCGLTIAACLQLESLSVEYVNLTNNVIKKGGAVALGNMLRGSPETLTLTLGRIPPLRRSCCVARVLDWTGSLELTPTPVPSPNRAHDAHPGGESHLRRGFVCLHATYISIHIHTPPIYGYSLPASADHLGALLVCTYSSLTG